MTVGSVHVFTKYFTRVLKQFSLKLVVLIEAGCWLGLYLFLGLFSLVQNNLGIASVVIFGQLLLILSGESLY